MIIIGDDDEYRDKDEEEQVVLTLGTKKSGVTV